MDPLIDTLARMLHALGPFAYLVVALFAFGENVILIAYFLPGVLVLAFVGFLCSIKVYSFGGMLLATYLGHFLGELANYELGRRGGRPLFQAHHRTINLDLLDQVERRFHENALHILVVGKFIGLIRPLVSFTAGMIHYPRPRYVILMVGLDLIWALAYLGLGYVLGTGWRQAPRYLQYGGLGILLLAGAYLTAHWLLAHRRKKPDA